MPVIVVIAVFLALVLVYVLREKRSINKHKKNQNYKSANIREVEKENAKKNKK